AFGGHPRVQDSEIADVVAAGLVLGGGVAATLPSVGGADRGVRSLVRGRMPPHGAVASRARGRDRIGDVPEDTDGIDHEERRTRLRVLALERADLDGVLTRP